MRIINLPEYTLSKTCLHIEDSFKVRKRDMRAILAEIRNYTVPGQTDVFKRSLFSLKMEWIAHNFLYKIGYKRKQTGSVDLDNPCDRPEWLYIICGLLTWIFVW